MAPRSTGGHGAARRVSTSAYAAGRSYEDSSFAQRLRLERSALVAIAMFVDRNTVL